MLAVGRFLICASMLQTRAHLGLHKFRPSDGGAGGDAQLSASYVGMSHGGSIFLPRRSVRANLTPWRS